MNYKIVTQMKPVDVIIFEDGTEAYYVDVCNDIWDMYDKNYTDFDRNNAYDNAMYQFIVQNERFNDTVGKVYPSTRNPELIGISWLNNRKFVGALLDELKSMQDHLYEVDK